MPRPLDRNALVSPRLAFESVGRGGSGFGLDRQDSAGYVVQLADASLLAEGVTPFWDVIRTSSPAVVAEFGSVTLVTQRGFWLLGLHIVTANTVFVGNAPAAPLPAGGTVNRWQPQGPTDVQVFAGTSLGAVGNQAWFAGTTYATLPSPIWVPPGQLGIGAGTLNAAQEYRIVLAQPPPLS